MTDPRPEPRFGEIITATAPGWESVPNGPNPFYMAFQEGLMLHRQMLFGKGMVKAKSMPATLPKLGSDKGQFIFDRDHPIPAVIMGQVVDFFTRIYDYQHTEAAVILVMHSETKEWRVYVPTQLVSHGGVNYVFDPLTIRPPWYIVGSIHSHCDFGAGHSSTDTGDAEYFNGFHATIGHIKRDIPEIVAMVSLNGQNFHYNPDQFHHLFDFSEVRQHAAPGWWDRYVEDTKQKFKPVGFELYKKFDRPTIVKSETTKTTKTTAPSNPTGFMSKDWTYNEKAKRMVHKDWLVDDNGVVTYGKNVGKGQNGVRTVSRAGSDDSTPGLERWDSSNKRPFVLTEDEKALQPWLDQLSVRELMELGFDWDAKHHAWRFSESNLHANDTPSGVILGPAGELLRGPTSDTPNDDFGLEDRFWEEKLGRELLDAIFDGPNPPNDDEIDFALASPKQAGDKLFWRQLYMAKALHAVNIINATGAHVQLVIKDATEPPADLDLELLPDDTVKSMKVGEHFQPFKDKNLTITRVRKNSKPKVSNRVTSIVRHEPDHDLRGVH